MNRRKLIKNDPLGGLLSPTVLDLNAFLVTQNNKQYKFKDNINHMAGRNKIGKDQELNYAAIIKAILAKSFKGYVAQEFIAKSKNKIKLLLEAIAICDI